MSGKHDIVLDAPPQPPLAQAQPPCGRACWSPVAQGEAEGLLQQHEAATLARPRHWHLGRLAAGHPRDLGMQQGLEMEEVQTALFALHPVVDALAGCAAQGAMQRLGVAAKLEVDAVPGGAELYGLYRPRCMQT